MKPTYFALIFYYSGDLRVRHYENKRDATNNREKLVKNKRIQRAVCYNAKLSLMLWELNNETAKQNPS